MWKEGKVNPVNSLSLQVHFCGLELQIPSRGLNFDTNLSFISNSSLEFAMHWPWPGSTKYICTSSLKSALTEECPTEPWIVQLGCVRLSSAADSKPVPVDRAFSCFPRPYLSNAPVQRWRHSLGFGPEQVFLFPPSQTFRGGPPPYSIVDSRRLDCWIWCGPDQGGHGMSTGLAWVWQSPAESGFRPLLPDLGDLEGMRMRRRVWTGRIGRLQGSPAGKCASSHLLTSRKVFQHIKTWNTLVGTHRLNTSPGTETSSSLSPWLYPWANWVIGQITFPAMVSLLHSL